MPSCNFCFYRPVRLLFIFCYSWYWKLKKNYKQLITAALSSAVHPPKLTHLSTVHRFPSFHCFSLDNICPTVYSCDITWSFLWKKTFSLLRLRKTTKKLNLHSWISTSVIRKRTQRNTHTKTFLQNELSSQKFETNKTDDFIDKVWLFF